MKTKCSERLSTLKRGIAAAAIGIAAGLLPAGAAFADYDDALNAYASQKFENAVDLWVRYAVAGDVKSKQALGDVYAGKGLEAGPEYTGVLTSPSDTGVIPQDDVEALAWYILAANHDFDSYNQSPTYRDVNAKFVAQEQIPILKKRMSDNDVYQSQLRVVEILSAESEFDLYRLGMMFQTGAGLPKDNIEALKYFELAKGRNRNSNAPASEAAKYLITLMNPRDVDTAQDLAANWEPPLPEALKNKTPRQEALEMELARLRSIQLAEAIDNIEEEFSNNEDLLQSSLAALGFYQGSIDGKVGPETRTSVRNFQYSLYQKNREMTEEEKRNKMTGTLSPEQKVQLVQLAADREHPQSQYVYGIMYTRGIGVAKNGEKAVYWLKKSANYGYSLAHYALGVAFRDGIYGEDPVEPDVSEATFHFGQAYALGHQQAQEDLIKLRYEAVPATNIRGSQEN
ncbi:hypothetical protein FF098_013450 [Parvularcula flava]|uniref:Peptidoglycan binding-like domain-containing protein n=1 Tax=Aquisalinus luteolus TaxID=1566827 RepID=A0A8J3A6B0_9PROT|nr:peptidoglycan-binding protein [Aquisalinus luteolus]NHK28922.1 hypothetical protein [Aquisalinus luteolus]GGI00848.1 hypothetical protein GCM10011355_30110 [Aquisalinus luteolus]